MSDAGNPWDRHLANEPRGLARCNVLVVDRTGREWLVVESLDRAPPGVLALCADEIGELRRALGSRPLSSLSRDALALAKVALGGKLIHARALP